METGSSSAITIVAILSKRAAIGSFGLRADSHGGLNCIQVGSDRTDADFGALVMGDEGMRPVCFVFMRMLFQSSFRGVPFINVAAVRGRD